MTSADENEITQFALAAFATLFDPTRESEPLSLPSASKFRHWPPFERVNITLRCHGHVRGSMSASGPTFPMQLLGALRAAAADRRFGGPITRLEQPVTILELWIQLSSEPQVLSEPDSFVIGRDGLTLKHPSGSAYFKPSVAITGRYRTLLSLAAALVAKAKLPPQSIDNNEAQFFRTSWVCLQGSSQIPRRLEHLRLPQPSQLSEALLTNWAEASARYLINHQLASGAVTYLYDPIADRAKRRPLNIVRAAGCFYALARFLKSSVPDKADVFHGTREIARFLKANCLRQHDTLVLVDPKARGLPKLGATALLYAGMQLIGEAEPSETTRHLRQSVFGAQQPDGSFRTHFGSMSLDQRAVEFYPGQALLSLVIAAEGGDTEALDRVLGAFEYYKSHFRNMPTTAFVGWHIEVWARVARLTGNGEIAEFAFEQAKWLLQFQVIEHDLRHLAGGFARAGRMPNFSSIVFTEAVLAAANLAFELSQPDTHELFRSVRRGLEFCALLRLEAIPDYYFPRTDLCRGGVSLGLSDLLVRCDTVQHLLTLALNASHSPGLLS